LRILIFHGYLLRGTGSNIYNASLVEALTRLGHEVHLLCQDRDASELPFVDAVGRWDGDALVVDSIALDDRVWADMWGHPISSKARITERYRRPAFDTLELQMTITDPDLYTRPWTSDVKVHRLQVEKAMDDRLETFCVPSEEENFNKAIRDPAGGVVR